MTNFLILGRNTACLAMLFVVAFFLLFPQLSGAQVVVVDSVTLTPSVSGTSVTLSWTTLAETALHEVRYATSPLDESNWSSGSVAGGVPGPVPNADQNVTISGLAASTPYYFGYRYETTFGGVGFAFTSATTESDGGGGDIFAPGPVLNLTATAAGTTAIALSWTAPSDTDIANYDARWSTSPINASNFNSATAISGVPLPIPNASQNVTVGGLTAATTYYFAIKVLDTVGNESPIATASATTGSDGGGGGGGGGSGGGGGGSGGGSGGGGSSSPVSFFINNGDEKTTTTTVTLNINAPNATRMQFSRENNFAGATWLPYATTSIWELTLPNGEKTVYANFVRDLQAFGVGAYENIGTAWDSIVLEAATSTIPAAIPEPVVVETLPPTPAPVPAPALPLATLERDLVSFNSLMVNWGAHTVRIPQDLNRDFVVDGVDVREFLGEWTRSADEERASLTKDLFGNTIVTLTPGEIREMEDSEFMITFLAHPAEGRNYTAQISFTFPPELAEFVSFTYSGGWVPVIRDSFDVSDNTHGLLVKTAGHPEGFSEPTIFGFARFRAKAAGEGVFAFRNNGFSLDGEGNDVLSASLGGASLAFESNVSAPALFLANVLTLWREGNMTATLVTFALLFIVYFVSRRRTRAVRKVL